MFLLELLVFPLTPISATLHAYFPRVFELYKTAMDALSTWEVENLHRSFPGCEFPMHTLNLGPNVCTYKHRDLQNYPFGICAVFALGHFNHKTGGHLVLWDLDLVLELAPGGLALLPSALLTHSNVSIADGESRASYVLYAPGELFRFVENDMRTDTAMRADDPDLYQNVRDCRNAWWKHGIEMFTPLADRQPNASETLGVCG